MTTTFTKTYRNPGARLAAQRHHEWLTGLDSGVRLPALLEVRPDALVFEHLTGPHPRPQDLPQVAHALGRLHTAAAAVLYTARLDQPAVVTPDLTIVDFYGPRRAVLERFPVDADQPVALYKDTNLRNILLTDDGPALVDFDDLTIAPYGYDLAKLVVSTAMTHGHLSAGLIDDTLGIYDAATSTTNPAGCAPGAFWTYTEIHHHLTVRFLHRNGYEHPWPHVRPW